MFKSLGPFNKNTAKEIHDNFLSLYGVDLDLIYLYFDNEAESENIQKKLSVKVSNYESNEKEKDSSYSIKWKVGFFSYFERYEVLYKKFNNEKLKLSKDFDIYVENDIIVDLNKQFKELEEKFAKSYKCDFKTCFVACQEQYQEYKKKKMAQKNNDYNNIDSKTFYFQQFWNVISQRNIGNIRLVNNIIKYCYPCPSGNRRDTREELLWQDINITNLFHNNIDEKGTINHIYEKLDCLVSTWNNHIKIAILLDLYWDIQEASSKMTQIKIKRCTNEEDYRNKVHKAVSEKRKKSKPLTGKSELFVPAFFENTYTIFDKRNVEKYIDETIKLVNQKKLLYPFIPNIQYDKSHNEVVVPEALSEITLNILLNKDIQKFYSNDFDQIGQGKNIKYKTFNDLISIYTEQFSSTKIQDYYLLESFTCLNLSMKLYDYLWPFASEILNDRTDIGKQNKLYDYLNKIVSSLLMIRSPYLRLRITDIVIQSYKATNNINKTQYIAVFENIAKILNQYIETVNDTYDMVYDAIYYYAVKLGNDNNYSNILNEMAQLINIYHDYYIRLDPDSICSDVKANNIWGDLLKEKRGIRKVFYHNIIKSIMLNRLKS